MKRLFLFAMILFSLSGCDFHSTCDCFDECERAIPFSFCTDSLTSGFRVSEIDTIILYKLPKAQSDPADSIQMYFDPVNKGFIAPLTVGIFVGHTLGFLLTKWGHLGKITFRTSIT